MGRWRGLALLAMVVAGGCSCSCARDDRDRTRAPDGRFGDDAELEPPPKTMRVGNQAGGIDEMPDYDREAIEVREAVADRLPDPLPSVEAACESMLQAVHRHYTAADGESAQSVRILERTHDADLAACRKRTAAAAAACVIVLVHEQRDVQEPLEYPKLLDQCTRAFPRT